KLGGEFRQLGVTQQGAFDAPERRICYHRDIVLLAPWQHVALNVGVPDTVRNLIGCASMAVWDTEQSFHLVNVEVGYAPSANLSLRAQTFEFGYNAGETAGGDR